MSTYSYEEIKSNFWGIIHDCVKTFADEEFIVTPTSTLTYTQGNQSANVISRNINELHLGRGVGIGIFLRDPAEAVPCMMGVLKSGDYFTHLDVSFPKEAILDMLDIAVIKVVLTSSEFIDVLRAIIPVDLSVLNIDKLDYRQAVSNPVPDYSLDDIVQILFTSGSTGKPKGAIETYRYLSRSSYIRLNEFDFRAEDRFLQLSTFSFSAPHATVFSSLMFGGTVCFFPIRDHGLGGVPQWISKQKITVYSSTPTVFRNLVSHLSAEDQFPTVRLFHVGGEKRFASDIQAIKRHFPNAKYVRLGYASTEAQVISFQNYPIDHDFGQEEIPCGRPSFGLTVFIWDKDGKALPPGEEGEIVVYSDALVRGYIGDPALTTQKFIPDPENPGAMYFKTADLGKILPDGQLVHLGRMDNMVKIKGVRIELDSIDRILSQFPGIVQFTSSPVMDRRGNQKLAGYYVPEKGVELTVSDIRKHLAERLPSHLLPHYIIKLESIPETPTGKVDRQALPPPQFQRPNLANLYTSPKDELEEKLVALWENEIGIDGIGVEDDFFDLGGDSLIGVMLFISIEKALGRSLPGSVLLTPPTVRRQAELIRNSPADDELAPIIPIRMTGNLVPLIFIPGRGVYPTRIRPLAERVGADVPVYALHNLSRGYELRPFKSMQALAAYYVTVIKKTVPKGPVILIGESMGGKVALEVAQQLTKQGDKVPYLVMLDT